MVFESVGPGAIAVVGPHTGARYQFGQAGARVTVHGADVPALLGVSGLKPVR